jgi:hypothetical protein
VDTPSEAPAPPVSARPAATRPGLVVSVAVAAAVAVLAVVETSVALVAPALAPKEADWEAASQEIRAGFRGGDLIVAAPAWADPIMRVHLGDLVPVAIAGRLDDARFGRIWELSQRGARAPESARGTVVVERRFGSLTLRRVERAPAIVTYDFLERLTDARVTRLVSAPGGGGGGAAGRPEVVCPWAVDRFQCPDIGFNFVRLQTVEVDTKLHRGLLAQPVGDAVVAVEYPAVPLGRELVVATGLHDVWMRKAAHGAVNLRVVVAGTPAAAITTTNDTGWLITRVDSAAYAGRVVTVRFEIASPAPYARHFAFAAEARR